MPSRRRVGNMPPLLELLPDATIAVAASEREDYLRVVPKKQLITHDELPNVPAIRNWLSDTIQEDCLVQIDDDLKGVRPLIGKQRLRRDPRLIGQIIENGHRVAEDLGLGVFCWSRTQNSFLADPQFLPYRFVQPVSSSFGLRGSARRRRFDEELIGRADLDFTLQTLLEDRVLLADMRWLFDHGRIFSGRGGAVGTFSAAQVDRSTDLIHRRWGRYVGRKPPAWIKRSSTRPMSIRVKRQSPLARQ